jgi:hypothetical protein
MSTKRIDTKILECPIIGGQVDITIRVTTLNNVVEKMSGFDCNKQSDCGMLINKEWDKCPAHKYCLNKYK